MMKIFTDKTSAIKKIYLPDFSFPESETKKYTR